MTASKATNVVLTKGGKTVTIANVGYEEVWQKKLQPIDIPTSVQNQDIATGAKETKLLDNLMKAQERITVRGHLATGVGDSDTSNDAEGKRDDLKSMFFAGGVISMTAEGSTFNMNTEQIKVSRRNLDGLTELDGVAEFDIQATFIKGVDLSG